MLKRHYPLILIVFLMSACTHRTHEIAPIIQGPVKGYVKQTVAVAPFNQVDVKGRINVNLSTGARTPSVVLSGDPRDLAQIHTSVNQSTLYLSLGRGYPRFGEVSAQVNGRFLNRLQYVGAGVINGKRLNTSLLDVSVSNPGTTTLKGRIGLGQLDVNGNGMVQIGGITGQNLRVHLTGSPKVQLAGTANLTQLDINGNAWLSLYWIKSDYLTVRAKRGGMIQFAGAVNHLDVELWGHAQFKGRYLRAQRSFVKTHGRSVAEISAVNHQSTLATDASDIYYYNSAATRADFMAYNGSVLDMREWDQPELKDFTRYNKQFP